MTKPVQEANNHFSPRASIAAVKQKNATTLHYDYDFCGYFPCRLSAINRPNSRFSACVGAINRHGQGQATAPTAILQSKQTLAR
jgi:hypothetical protein